MDCKDCIHNVICQLWRENECQDASCYSDHCFESGTPHVKIQYGNEELTVQELCARLKLAECRAITAENDKASLLQDKRSTDLYIRDKDSGRIHRVGDECHDALWVDVDGTVHYSNLQNGDGCADYSQIDPNAGYEFMPSDFRELMVCLSNC